jgi:hypothetical protein
VATSGERRLWLLAVSCVGALSCAPAPRAGEGHGPPAPPAAFCPVELPAAWQDAIKVGAVQRREGELLRIVAGGADGASLFAESTIPQGGIAELVWLRDRGRVRRVIRSLDHAAGEQVLGAAFDGRYLVFSVLGTRSDFDHWTLYAWQVPGSEPAFEIARAAQDAGGRVLAGPLAFPVVHEGRAAWTQVEPGEVASVHLYDLARRRDRVVRRGQVDRPFRMGSLVVWPESDTPGALSHLEAAWFATGRRAELPPTVRSAVVGAAFVQASDDALVWVTATMQELYVWRPGWGGPTRVLGSPKDRPLQWPHVAGEIVTWDDSTAQFALDLRTGAYARVTPRWGATDAFGPYLEIGFPPPQLVPDAPANDAVLDTRALPPLPGCASAI